LQHWVARAQFLALQPRTNDKVIGQNPLLRRILIGQDRDSTQQYIDLLYDASPVTMATFWGITPLSLAEVYRRFRGDNCIQHQCNDSNHDGGSKHLSDFYQFLPEYTTHLHNLRCENVKYHILPVIYQRQNIRDYA
jgi:hypothetical protein